MRLQLLWLLLQPLWLLLLLLGFLCSDLGGESPFRHTGLPPTYAFAIIAFANWQSPCCSACAHAEELSPLRVSKTSFDPGDCSNAVLVLRGPVGPNALKGGAVAAPMLSGCLLCVLNHQAGGDLKGTVSPDF